jgi:RHS repeat-associated protein
MLPAAEERIPALGSGEEIFSLDAGVALAALETHQGAREAQGKKPHQGIFSKNRALRVGEILAKWSGTHQDRKCSWSKTVVGSALDANGNTLTDASGKSYTWDFENRLTQAVVPGTNGGTTTFKYDPFGRRIQKSGPLGTTNYLYDGHNDIEEVDSSGNVLARYTQGPRIDQPLAELRSGTTSFYQQDALRSVTSLSNAAGALANTYTFDSFGKLTASTGALTNLFQYTARESDPETGLYYYRERYYDLSAGRFVSEDPVRFGSGDVDFYAYVRNHPQNVGDPFGLCPPDKPHCFAQLKYRSSYEFFSHAFWWVQDSNGTNWVIDGGPSLPHGHGYLNSWVNLGDSGHYETDNSDDATAFDSGTSDAVCDAVDKMILAAENWQNNTTPYSSTGPNSNTFAHDIGNAGGFNPPAPPRTIGW